MSVSLKCCKVGDTVLLHNGKIAKIKLYDKNVITHYPWQLDNYMWYTNSGTNTCSHQMDVIMILDKVEDNFKMMTPSLFEKCINSDNRQFKHLDEDVKNFLRRYSKHIEIMTDSKNLWEHIDKPGFNEYLIYRIDPKSKKFVMPEYDISGKVARNIVMYTDSFGVYDYYVKDNTGNLILLKNVEKMENYYVAKYIENNNYYLSKNIDHRPDHIPVVIYFTK